MHMDRACFPNPILGTGAKTVGTVSSRHHQTGSYGEEMLNISSLCQESGTATTVHYPHQEVERG
jgi:hypothetical protein